MKSNGNKPLTEEQKQNKIARAEHYYGKFMSSLGFEWETDPNVQRSHRVAKAWVNDLAEGCFNHHPRLQHLIMLIIMMVWYLKVTYKYIQCVHIIIFFFGVAHVAYHR